MSSDWYGWLAVFLLFNIALGMWRIIRGPTHSDRILTAMLFGTTGVGSLLLLFGATGETYFIDVALVFSLFGSMTATAFVRRAMQELSELKEET